MAHGVEPVGERHVAVQVADDPRDPVGQRPAGAGQPPHLVPVAAQPVGHGVPDEPPTAAKTADPPKQMPNQPLRIAAFVCCIASTNVASPVRPRPGITA